MASDASAQELFTGTKPVADTHKFDEARLATWMEQHVEGYQGPLEVRQFSFTKTGREGQHMMCLFGDGNEKIDGFVLDQC